MSGAEGNNSNELENRWANFDQKKLFVYVLTNFDKVDCSFNVLGENGEIKVVKSFQWILKEISPYIRRFLDGQPLLARDKNFETMLSYAHTKILRNQCFEQLLSLYKSANRFGIKPLKEKIICMLQENIENKEEIGTKWLYLFEVAYTEKQTEQQLFYLFDKFKETMSVEDMEQGLEDNMERVLTFKPDLFYDFLYLLKSKNVNPGLCFKTAESYLVKRGININCSEGRNIGEDIMILLLENIDLTEMELEDLEKGPQISKFLNEETKECILADIQYNQQ